VRFIIDRQDKENIRPRERLADKNSTALSKSGRRKQCGFVCDEMSFAM